MVFELRLFRNGNKLVARLYGRQALFALLPYRHEVAKSVYFRHQLPAMESGLLVDSIQYEKLSMIFLLFWGGD